MRKNHDSEWAHHGILAEIDSREVAAVLYPNHLAGDALVFAYVLASLGNRDAVRSRQGREDQCQQQKSTAGWSAESAPKLRRGKGPKNPGGPKALYKKHF